MRRSSLLLSALFAASALHAAPPIAASPGTTPPSASPAKGLLPPASPPALGDGWPVASAAASGWNLALLAQMEQALADDLAPSTTSVLIVRDGVLVYEHYLGDATRGNPA